jgi:hypothetical protein
MINAYPAVEDFCKVICIKVEAGCRRGCLQTIARIAPAKLCRLSEAALPSRAG